MSSHFLILWLALSCLLSTPVAVCAQESFAASQLQNTKTASQTSVPPQQCAANVQLSPGANQVARLIGVCELVERLHRLPAGERGPGPEMSLEAMKLRQQLTEVVLAASLDADGVIAELDSETEKLAVIRSFLEARRDRALQIGAVANIVASGTGGILGTALQFGENTANAGNWIGIAGNSISTVLSLIGLRQQQGGKYALRESPNMLAPLFGRETEFHSNYPDAIWQYLNLPTPTEPDKGTRTERLRKEWSEFGRIDEKASAKGLDKIAFLTSRSSEGRKLTIDLLSDRAAMLADLKVWVELFKRDLSKLMLALRAS